MKRGRWWGCAAPARRRAGARSPALLPERARALSGRALRERVDRRRARRAARPHRKRRRHHRRRLQRCDHAGLRDRARRRRRRRARRVGAQHALGDAARPRALADARRVLVLVQRRRVELRGEREGEVGRGRVAWAPHGARARVGVGVRTGLGRSPAQRARGPCREMSASRPRSWRGGSPAARTPAPSRARCSPLPSTVCGRAGAGAVRGEVSAAGGGARAAAARGGGGGGGGDAHRCGLRYGTVESCDWSSESAASCCCWRSAHWPPIPVRVGCEQRRCWHACFFTPAPPNFGLSRQLGQRPQSPRRQPSQPPQRSTRSTLTGTRLPGGFALASTESAASDDPPASSSVMTDAWLGAAYE